MEQHTIEADDPDTTMIPTEQPSVPAGGTTRTPSEGGLFGETMRGSIVSDAVMADDWGPMTMGSDALTVTPDGLLEREDPK